MVLVMAVSSDDDGGGRLGGGGAGCCDGGSVERHVAKTPPLVRTARELYYGVPLCLSPLCVSTHQTLKGRRKP